jgi:hypothetical protein
MNRFSYKLVGRGTPSALSGSAPPIGRAESRAGDGGMEGWRDGREGREGCVYACMRVCVVTNADAAAAQAETQT